MIFNSRTSQASFASWGMTLFLSVIASLILFHHLNLPFYLDQDTQRIFFASQPLARILAHSPDNRNPNFIYILLHFATRWSIRESRARFPFALFAVLAIMIFHRAALSVSTPLQACLATAIFMFNPAFLSNSRAVSWVPVFLLFSILFLWMLGEIMDGHLFPQSLFFLGSIVGLEFTSYSAYFLLSVGAVYAGWKWRERRARAVLWVMSLLLIGLILGTSSLRGLMQAIHYEPSERSLALSNPSLIWGNLDFSGYWNELRRMFFPSPLSLLLALMFIFGLCRAWRVRHRNHSGLWLFSALTPLIGFFLISLMRVKIYYFQFAMPGVALVSAGGALEAVARLRSFLGRGRNLAASSMSLVLVAALLALDHKSRDVYQPSPRADIPRIIKSINQDRSRRVYFAPNNLYSLFLYYGAKNPVSAWKSCQIGVWPAIECRYDGWIVRGFVERGQVPPNWDLRCNQDLRAAQKKHSFWWIETHDFYSPGLRAFLKKHCRMANSGGQMHALYYCPRRPRVF